VISNSAGGLTLNLLAGTTLTTLRNGASVEVAGGGSLLDAELIGITGDSTRQLLAFETHQPFDAVRINFRSAVSLLSELRVYQACTAP
jgi:hypothetical protein